MLVLPKYRDTDDIRAALPVGDGRIDMYVAHVVRRRRKAA